MEIKNCFCNSSIFQHWGYNPITGTIYARNNSLLESATLFYSYKREGQLSSSRWCYARDYSIGQFDLVKCCGCKTKIDRLIKEYLKK
jgi:hypothetical protein